MSQVFGRRFPSKYTSDKRRIEHMLIDKPMPFLFCHGHGAIEQIAQTNISAAPNCITYYTTRYLLHDTLHALSYHRPTEMTINEAYVTIPKYQFDLLYQHCIHCPDCDNKSQILSDQFSTVVSSELLSAQPSKKRKLLQGILSQEVLQRSESQDQLPQSIYHVPQCIRKRLMFNGGDI